MNRIDRDARMRELLAENVGKRLLLHSCCAPCSTHCLGEVTPFLRTTVFYYNPNLDSEEEYRKRKGEQIRFLKETGLAEFLDCDYDAEAYTAATKGLEGEPEGGKRCEVCFELRLRKTAETARRLGFDFFGTTLTVSPLKNAQKINEIGERLAAEVGVAYLVSDFKKRNGYLHSIELSRAHGLYRQNYCGCIYSRRPPNDV